MFLDCLADTGTEGNALICRRLLVSPRAGRVLPLVQLGAGLIDDLPDKPALGLGVRVAPYAARDEVPFERRVLLPIVVVCTQPRGEQAQVSLGPLIRREQVTDRGADSVGGNTVDQ